MAYREESYIGNGKLWLKKRGSTDPFREVGNCSAINLGIETEESSLLNYRGGGGEINKRERISAVSLSITAHDFSADNLALATRGDVSASASASVSAEVHSGVNSGLIRTNSLIDTAQTVSVSGPSGTPTHTAGTDYTVAAAGIEVIEGGAITNAADVEITYESLATDIVDALMNSGNEYEMVADLINEAQSSRFVVDLWRAKAAPADELALIGDDYGAQTLPFALLLDTTKEAAGESGYFRVHKQVLS